MFIGISRSAPRPFVVCGVILTCSRLHKNGSNHPGTLLFPLRCRGPPMTGGFHGLIRHELLLFLLIHVWEGKREGTKNVDVSFFLSHIVSSLVRSLGSKQATKRGNSKGPFLPPSLSRVFLSFERLKDDEASQKHSVWNSTRQKKILNAEKWLKSGHENIISNNT